MLAEAKSEAYAKGIGSMSAEDKSEANAKGLESKSASSKGRWEEKYTKFEAHDWMPAKGTKLYIWQKNQLSSVPKGLDAIIEKEIEANEGSTAWRDKKSDTRSLQE
jgi:hypothetical protein